MTPEQREKAVEKMRKERKEAHEKYAKETMAKLTPGQKAEVQQFIKDDMAQRKARHWQAFAAYDSRAARGCKSQQTAAAKTPQG